MPLKKAVTSTEIMAELGATAEAKIVEITGKSSGVYIADAKGRQISRQGLFQAALQSPAIMQYCPDLPSYLKVVREVAEEGLRFVNE